MITGVLPVSNTFLSSRFAVAVAQARRSGSTMLVSQTFAIPAPNDVISMFAAAQTRYEHSAYWERPAEGVTLIGVGAARLIRCDGANRFQDAARQLHDDRENVMVDNFAGFSDALTGPVYLGGFSFDIERRACAPWADLFPDGLLILPRFLLAIREGAATMTVNVLVEPGAILPEALDALTDDLVTLLNAGATPLRHERVPRITREDHFPAPGDWKRAVKLAAAHVRSGRFEKIVLARELRLQADTPFVGSAVLRRLRIPHPSAYVFAVAVPGACFLGATPELLARVINGNVDVACLAGSTRRGATLQEDAQLGAELLASAKDRIEHAVVARSIEEALARLCVDVRRASAEPELMRLHNIQHLRTGFQARLAGDHCLVSLTEALHPTAAVGGFPRDIAMDEIRKREMIDRGWYAGAIGWVNWAGEGEMAVAIRSALLAGRQASLYAGCGIVADSDPEAEFAETCLKMRAMRHALGADP